MTYPIRIHQIQPVFVVNGPGQCTVVFFQGCSLHCPGCQNRHLWPADQGHLTAVDLCLLGVWWAWLTASLVPGVLFVLIGVLYSEYIHAR